MTSSASSVHERVTAWVSDDRDEVVSVAPTDVGGFGEDLDEDRRVVDEAVRKFGRRVRLPVVDEGESTGSSEGIAGSVRRAEMQERYEATRKHTRALDNLRDMADRDRRIAMTQARGLMRRGRDVGGAELDETKETPMLRFSPSERIFVEKLTDTSFKDLVSDLLGGSRKVVELVGTTGMGKSTRLPAELATKCNMRVLVLQPHMSMVAESRQQLSRSVTVTSRTTQLRRALVRVMTYSDFNRLFWTGNGTNLLKSFDVVLLDETHLPLAEVYVAKVILATLSPQSMSIVSMTATVGDDDAQLAARTGSSRRDTVPLFQLVKEGAFVGGDRCNDQTMIILPTDSQVNLSCKYLQEAGLVVYTLDSVSSASDVAGVRTNMSGSSPNKRFLVAHEMYGTGYNFPVKYVHTSGTRVVYEFPTATSMVEKEVALSDGEIKQHCGRAGRNMTKGAVSCVNSPFPAAAFNDVLVPQERLKAYMLLKAAHLTPIKPLVPSAVLLPFGVTSAVAADVLRTGLPPELAIRFFSRDGHMPASYVRALESFTVESSFLSSRHSKPVGEDLWVEDYIGGYYGSEVSEAAIRVPVVVEGDMRIRVHAICALADKLIRLEPWRPVSSESDSEPEQIEKRVAFRGDAWVPRMLENKPLVREAEPLPVPEYSYNAPTGEQFRGLRIRSGIHGDFLPTNMLDALAHVDDGYDPGYAKVVEKGVERFAVTAAEKPVAVEESPVVVSSPGGNSVVAKIRATTFRELKAGNVVSEGEMYGLLQQIKHTVPAFALSDTFANWNNFWLGIARTLADERVIQFLVDRNMDSVVVRLIMSLFERYSEAVASVTRNSYTRARFLTRMFASSYEQALNRERSEGKADILQTQRFFKRVYLIREEFATAVMAMEKYGGFFSPTVVTQLQQTLSLTNPTGKDVIDRKQRFGGSYRRLKFRDK